MEQGWTAAVLAAVAAAGTLLWFLPARQRAVYTDSMPEISDGVAGDPGDATKRSEDTLRLALTFDDGPKASTTPVLLDGLSQRGVKATFFLIGQQIEENQALVLRMAEEGHQIALHSFSHVKLQGLSAEALQSELEHARRALTSLLGEKTFFLRPPYGMLDDQLRAAAESPIILWSVDPEDWNHPDAQRVSQHILENARDGDIILLHDIYPESVEAALTVIDTLQEQGCVFLTVEELLLTFGVEPVPGAVYRRGGG